MSGFKVLGVDVLGVEVSEFLGLYLVGLVGMYIYYLDFVGFGCIVWYIGC